MRRSTLPIALLAAAASCASVPHVAAPTRRLGDAMDEAGLRFERAGRAVASGRWDIAKDDLHELDEIFEQNVTALEWRGEPRLSQLARRFKVEDLPALHKAVGAHDQNAFEQAAEAAARGCNECHRAADQSNIEISVGALAAQR